MRRFFFQILALLLFVPFCSAGAPRFPDDWPQIAARLKSADYTVLDELNASNRIDDLYVILRECSWDEFGESSTKVASATRERLEKIPGHAIPLGDKIDELSREKGNKGERRAMLSNLQRARTPEAIAQLGRFLYDERNPDLEDWRLENGGPYPHPNAPSAAWAILNIQKLPIAGVVFSDETDIPMVRAWWESEAGKPYRDLLAASGRGYAGQNPAAPPIAPAVAPQPSPPQTQTPATPSRDQLGKAGQPMAVTSHPAKAPSAWKWWAAGTLLLLLAAGWRLKRKRRGSAS